MEAGAGGGATFNLDALAKREHLDLPHVYDPAKDREHARRNIAYGLVALLSLVVVGLLVAILVDLTSIENVKELAAVILGPIVVLVGTVSGFYFGGQKT